MLVTILGWGQVVKGFIHICFPAHSLRSMSLVEPQHYRRFVWAGAVMSTLAVVILVTSLR